MHELPVRLFASRDVIAGAVVRAGLIAGAALAGSVLFGLLTGAAYAGPPQDSEASETPVAVGSPTPLQHVTSLVTPLTEIDQDLTEIDQVKAAGGTAARGNPTDAVADAATEATNTVARTAADAATDVANAVTDTEAVVEPVVEPLAELIAPVPVPPASMLIEPIRPAVDDLIAATADAVHSTVDRIRSTPQSPPAVAVPRLVDPELVDPLLDMPVLDMAAVADPTPSPINLPALLVPEWLAQSAPAPVSPLAIAASAAGDARDDDRDPQRRLPPGPLPAPGGQHAGNANDNGPPVPWTTPPAAQPGADPARAPFPEDVTGSGTVVSSFSPPG